jgi:hypothetical protein
MPTGYTQDLYYGEKEVSFPEFALKCARAFGALIYMRDEPMDAPVRENTVSSYYRERLDRAERNFADVSSWTMQRAAAEAGKSCRQARDLREQMNAEARERRARFEAMLRQVTEWLPPTSDHADLKRFMAEQLSRAIEDECYELPVPEPVTPQEYRSKRLTNAECELAYARKDLAEEKERTVKRNEWLRALRSSLENS